MADNAKHTHRALPVLVGNNLEHVMGIADIHRSPSGVVEITVTALGEEGRLLGEFLEQQEPIAVSFIAIPVQNVRERREKT